MKYLAAVRVDDMLPEIFEFKTKKERDGFVKAVSEKGFECITSEIKE